MTVAEYIADFLKQKTDVVFLLQGGMITRLIDAIDIKIISMHHEQGVAMAVDAWSRMTGKPGVGMATSGPGAVNLLTGIASCYFDSTPAVFITGQVNTRELSSEGVRQTGFQETDIVAMATPITKAAWQAKTAKDIPVMFTKAWELAMDGRRGPVLIDIPIDLQNEEVS